MKFPAQWLEYARRAGALRASDRQFELRAWLAAPWVESSLAGLGLARTLAWIEALSPLGTGSEPAVEGVNVARGSHLIDVAYRGHLLLRGTCLPRSLLQYLLHRRDGRGVKLVIGVRTEDHAHAWIEEPNAAHSTHAEHFAPIFDTSSTTATAAGAARSSA